jgi:hypothetical protein
MLLHSMKGIKILKKDSVSSLIPIMHLCSSDLGLVIGSVKTTMLYVKFMVAIAMHW